MKSKLLAVAVVVGALTRFGLGDYYKWIHQQVADNVPYDRFVRNLLTAQGKNTEMQLDKKGDLFFSEMMLPANSKRSASRTP